MLHDRQGSIGIFGPYGYLIAAVDIAASADTTARSHITGETAPDTAPWDRPRLPVPH